MRDDTAIYHALDWAEGKTQVEISEEISELETHWNPGKTHRKNANWTYNRIITLQNYLNTHFPLDKHIFIV